MQLDPSLTCHHTRSLPSSVRIKLSGKLFLPVLFICYLVRQIMLSANEPIFYKPKCDFFFFLTINRIRKAISTVG